MQHPALPFLGSAPRRRDAAAPSPIDKLVMMHIGAVADRTDEAAIEEAKRGGHDFVIAGLGDRRLSAVTWTLIEADSADALAWLQENWPDPDLLDFARQNPGGLLVVSSCEYRP